MVEAQFGTNLFEANGLTRLWLSCYDNAILENDNAILEKDKAILTFSVITISTALCTQ